MTEPTKENEREDKPAESMETLSSQLGEGFRTALTNGLRQAVLEPEHPEQKSAQFVTVARQSPQVAEEILPELNETDQVMALEFCLEESDLAPWAQQLFEDMDLSAEQIKAAFELRHPIQMEIAARAINESNLPSLLLDEVPHQMRARMADIFLNLNWNSKVSIIHSALKQNPQANIVYLTSNLDQLTMESVLLAVASELAVTCSILQTSKAELTEANKALLERNSRHREAARGLEK
jgi:hypothetical protein